MGGVSPPPPPTPSLLLQPGGLVGSGGLQLDVELLQRLLQLLLVAREVGGDGVVEEEELLVHDLHLGGGKREEKASTGIKIEKREEESSKYRLLHR